MRVGYARVSTFDQDPEYQQRALEKGGCERIYTDKVSALKAQRPQLEAALDFLRPGDALVVWRFDRLARSTAEMLSLAAQIEKGGCELVSLTEQIDTSTPGGELVFTLFASVAQLERRINSERTREAIRLKKARGLRWGRPSRFSDPAFVRAAKTLLADKGLTKPQIAAQLGVCVSTVYRRFPGGDPEAFNPPVRSQAA